MDLSEIWRGFAKNSAMILGSRVTFGLLNLATNALVIQVFGLAELGVVLLLQAYTRIFSEIVKFQSWQAVLRFGAAAQERGDETGLSRLVGFTLGLDIVSFAIAIVAAVALAPWAAGWFDWPPDVAAFAPVFVVSLIFITHATPNGVMRLYNRVDTLAIQYSLNSVLRFACVGAAALFGGDVFHVVLAWFTGSVLSGCYLFVVTARELARQRLVPTMRVSWTRIGHEHPGIWRFLIVQNISTGIALILNYGTTVVVGGQIGAAAAATWEIARQIGGALAKPARLLGPLLFPELSRLAAREEWLQMRSLLKGQLVVSTAVLLVVATILLALLPLGIRLIFGAEAAEETWLFRLAVIGGLLALLGFLLEPAFLSANKPGTLLLTQIAGIVAFVVVALVSYPIVELTGLGLALLAYHLTYQALMLLIGRKLLKKRIRRSRALTDDG